MTTYIEVIINSIRCIKAGNWPDVYEDEYIVIGKYDWILIKCKSEIAYNEIPKLLMAAEGLVDKPEFQEFVSIIAEFARRSDTTQFPIGLERFVEKYASSGKIIELIKWYRLNFNPEKSAQQGDAPEPASPAR